MYALLLDLYFWEPELELLGGFREQYTVRMKIPWALQKHLGGQFQASHIVLSKNPLSRSQDLADFRNVDRIKYKFGSEDAPTPSGMSVLYSLALELSGSEGGLGPEFTSHPQIAPILKRMQREEMELGFANLVVSDDPINYEPNQMFWKNKDFEVYFVDDEIVLDLAQYKGAIKDQINALPSMYDAVAPLPPDNISASRRAQLMGLPAVKCRWTEYSLAKCNDEDEELGGSYHPLKTGDMVWQTTKGHCFGPDKGDGLYQPFYYNDSDVFRNPFTLERLPQDCFARARKEDDPDFPDGRNVRQRT